MNYHLITISLMRCAGACIVLFGLGLVGTVFLGLALLLEPVCWVLAWRGAKLRRARAL